MTHILHGKHFFSLCLVLTKYIYFLFFFPPECDPGPRQYAHEKNDTVIQFSSPTANVSVSQHVQTFILLDNWRKELKPFDYHPDPSFNELTKTVFTETSIISVTVSAEPTNHCR